MSSADGWEVWQKHVLSELERLHESDEKQAEKMDKILDQSAKTREAVAGLKSKASAWGAVAGAIPAIASLLYHWLTSK